MDMLRCLISRRIIIIIIIDLPCLSIVRPWHEQSYWLCGTYVPNVNFLQLSVLELVVDIGHNDR